jgi:glycogen debranching enzyme
MDQAMPNVWGGGQLLAFSALDGLTSFEHGLVGRTSFNRIGIDIMLPGTCEITFPGKYMQGLELAGDYFSLATSGGPVRGAFADAFHLLIEGACQAAAKSPAVTIVQHGNRTLVGSATCFKPELIKADLCDVIQQRRAWLERSLRQALPWVPAQQQRALAKALAMMKTQVYSPEGRIRHRWSTPDRWPHRQMWLWDSAFHAIGWRHIDPPLARELLSAVFDCQHPHGFIPHMMNPQASSQITQPPVLALAARLVNDAAPEPGWLAALYPKLAAYIRWDLANRDRDGDGLAEWSIEGDPHCRSGESGMDNSARFDEATGLAAVDFNAFLALECDLLADMAAELGRPAEAIVWREQHARLCQLINTFLWDPEQGFYFDYDPQRQARSTVMAGAGFLPLICGAASPAQAARLAAHLQNPATFGTPFKVATIAANDTAHYSKDMWRGPAWVNLNWLVAFGLRHYGLHEAANALTAQTLAEIERWYEQYGTLFEFYDDRQELPPPQLLRKGRCAPEVSPYHQVFHDYGWTATLYVDMVMGAQAQK